MRTIQILDRQNIIDIAIQYYGTAAAVIDLCLDNNLELDSTLTPGGTLLIQDTYPDSASSDVADYIQGNGIIVVSTTDENDGTALGTNNNEFIITNNNSLISVSTSEADTDFLITNDGEYIITNDINYIEVPQQQAPKTVPGK